MMREGDRKAALRGCSLALIALAFALAGCGDAAPVTSVLGLSSPGVEVDGETRPNVHCGWGAIWLPLEWDGVPQDTKELAVYIGRFRYVKDGGNRKLSIPYANLISGIDASRRGLSANQFLHEASWSNFGQSSCPVGKRDQRVLVVVFALDRAQAERRMKLRLAMRLTEEALAAPHPTAGPRSPGKLTRDAAAVGRLIATYPGPHSE